MRPVPVWSVMIAAAAAGLLVWVLAVPVAGVDLADPGPSGGPATTIGPAAVAITAALVTLLAWPVRALCGRRLDAGSRPVAWWVACGAVLVLSLGGPLGAGATAGAGALVALHVVVGSVVVVGLDPRRTVRRTPRNPVRAVEAQVAPSPGFDRARGGRG